MKESSETKLIAKYVAGTASDKEQSALLRVCRCDPKIAAQLAEQVKLERLLGFTVAEPEVGHAFAIEVIARLELDETDAAAFQEGVLTKIASVAPATALEKIKHHRLKIATVAASVAVTLAILSQFFNRQPDILATIMSLESVQWQQENTPWIIGQRLSQGRIVFESGFVELRFSSGTTVILEGPADLELVASNRAILHRGSIVADVPDQAVGFTVDCRDGEVIDMGTRFGMRTNESDGTEVHVLEGLVNTRSHASNDFLKLGENQAVRMHEQEPVGLEFEADASRFVTELPKRRGDAINYLHWSFDEGNGSTSRDSGSGLAAMNEIAHFKSYEDEKFNSPPKWSRGVFGSGVYFDGNGAYLDTGFKGIAGSNARTVAFWVRLPEDWSKKNGFGIVSWGAWEQGAVWQVSVNPTGQDGPIGRLRLGTLRGRIIGSTDLRDGEWHHVAVVMYGGPNANTGTHVFLYVDGNLETSSKKSFQIVNTNVEGPKALPLRMGLSIALAERGLVGHGTWFFRGWIDEVFVCDEALTSDQISELADENHCAGLAK